MIGAGTGVAYAAQPSLINAHTPQPRLAAADGLNSPARSLDSSRAGAVVGTLPSAVPLWIGASELPSLTAHRVLFTVCAGAAVAAAAIELVVSAGNPARLTLENTPDVTSHR
ncbi:hypothetical protein [Streptomyces fagopyri]|uniref:hypothetical protein n=1 Tax=Streptomyces fagopyri TaxID=2662397 RepID=UPI0033CF2370